MKKYLIIFSILTCFSVTSHAQKKISKRFFTPSDTFSQKRFNLMLSLGASTYVAASTGLYFAWYDQYPQTGFHFFDDRGEWLDMDKAGHVYSAYFQSLLCYQGAKWTGMHDDNAILTGALCGGIFQTTIEVMDGFSEKWGFSVADFTANAVGVSLFALQQKYWKEQRISMKISLIPSSYDEFSVMGSGGTIQSSKVRRDALFGSSYLERYLKDYNTQSYWLSLNVSSFLPKGNTWPKWLNVGIGYGAENMYGGYANNWTADGESFSVDPKLYPRTRQFFIGLDWNLKGIRSKNKLVNGILDILNIFRVPAPALEINSRGELTFHLFR